MVTEYPTVKYPTIIKAFNQIIVDNIPTPSEASRIEANHAKFLGGVESKFNLDEIETTLENLSPSELETVTMGDQDEEKRILSKYANATQVDNLLTNFFAEM